MVLAWRCLKESVFVFFQGALLKDIAAKKRRAEYDEDRSAKNDCCRSSRNTRHPSSREARRNTC
jgi:hypothetical protein